MSWDSTLEEGSWFSELTEARPVVCGGVWHVVGSDGKVSIERNCVSLSLSHFMSKDLKFKKVIKSFVPEQKKKKSRKCFVFLGFLCLRTFVNVFRIRMNMSIPRVRILVVYFWTWIYYSSSVLPAKNTYIHQLCADSGCLLKECQDRSLVSKDSKKERKREREGGREGVRVRVCHGHTFMMIMIAYVWFLPIFESI